MLARLPSLTARELIRVLEQAGFCFDRQNGYHATCRHPVTRRTTLIPIHTGELARWLMKKSSRMPASARMTFAICFDRITAIEGHLGIKS